MALESLLFQNGGSYKQVPTTVKPILTGDLVVVSSLPPASNSSSKTISPPKGSIELAAGAGTPAATVERRGEGDSVDRAG